ncbi:hypothetical protein [Paraburkholderia sp. SIMBA_054]|uniref:hypothetical protein n=1 Tax=Paraburkholderia sp. SIMBA_054 TaxID=3085795 RepID=UPI00397C4CA0
MTNRLMPWLFLIPVALCMASGAQAGDSGTGQSGDSLSLIITYHTAPANRPALRHELVRVTVPRLRRWQEEGHITRYRVLFSRFADDGNWDAMALLTFSNASEVAHWKQMEQRHPAALSARALALTTAIHTAPVDLMRAGSTRDASSDAVFVVIPYKTLVSADDYLKYADGYVIPQFNGWMGEGVLSRYALYVSDFPAGRPWSTLVILEYRNEAALAARNAVVAKVRENLKSNAAWKAISDNKKNVREEEQVVIADPLQGP